LINKFNKNSFAKKPVKGGTPAIENKETDKKSKELECKLNPAKLFNVLVECSKTVDRIQKIKIRETL
jgi:hypothetical protein